MKIVTLILALLLVNVFPRKVVGSETDEYSYESDEYEFYYDSTDECQSENCDKVNLKEEKQESGKIIEYLIANSFSFYFEMTIIITIPL
jgi:hypothetical protein